jgi:hypothetical protein
LNFLTGIKVCDYPNFARGQIQGAFGQIPWSSYQKSYPFLIYWFEIFICE